MDRLSFSEAQRLKLADLEDTRRHFRIGDAGYARAVSNARYFIMGASGCDIEDDAEVMRVMRAAYDGARSIDAKADWHIGGARWS